jgi:transcriptional regulator with XRE-family HTH domain
MNASGFFTQKVECHDQGGQVAFRAMNYKKEIGRRIKECREAMDWTLRELAERSDLSASRISNYEQGTRTPKPKEALALGKALGVNPSYLMCLEGDDGMNQEEMNLIRDWRALPENQRKEYARRIGTLALAYREPVADEKAAAYADPAKRAQVKGRAKDKKAHG